MQQQYFSVTHTLNLNLEPISASALPASFDDFVAEIPEPFMLSSNQEKQDLNLHRALKRLGDAGEALTLYLHQQAQKLDRVLSYVLLQQDKVEHRTHSELFGGSNLQCYWPQALAEQQWVRLKIFLPEESAAIYCYGYVQHCQASNEQFLADIHFHWIREEDIELLVRASLHIQSQQLKARAEARKQTD